MDRVTLLADVAGIVSRSHDLDETLGNVVDLVAKRLDADVCSVYLTDADLRHLTLSRDPGPRPRGDRAGAARRSARGSSASPPRAARPMAIEDAREHPTYRYFPETGEERFRSLMAAPLIVRGVTIGVLVVQTVERAPLRRARTSSCSRPARS